MAFDWVTRNIPTIVTARRLRWLETRSFVQSLEIDQLRAALRVNMLAYVPGVSNEEIDEVIRRCSDVTSLTVPVVKVQPDGDSSPFHC